MGWTLLGLQHSMTQHGQSQQGAEPTCLLVRHDVCASPLFFNTHKLDIHFASFHSLRTHMNSLLPFSFGMRWCLPARSCQSELTGLEAVTFWTLLSISCSLRFGGYRREKTCLVRLPPAHSLSKSEIGGITEDHEEDTEPERQPEVANTIGGMCGRVGLQV